MHTHSIAIDFGTSKTLVSHIDPLSGEPKILRLGRSQDMIPSAIYVDDKGQLSYGEEANDLIADTSGTYLRGFKMNLGSDTPLHFFEEGDGNLQIMTAKKLTALFLTHIRKKVEETVYHGARITKATITRPAIFSPAQCKELKEAAHEAGFEQVEITTEPESAGLAFCRLNATQAFRHSALIVDWGGGTLDLALVTRKDKVICTHSKLTDGDDSIGGEKFDEKLWHHVENNLTNKLNPVTQLPRVRIAKEHLSSKESFTLRLSHERGVCPPLIITRADFNKLIEADVNKSVQKVQALLARIPAEHKPEMLLLVGGSSQIPLIKERLEATCKLPVHRWQFSREAVALGAALWGYAPEPAPIPSTVPDCSPKPTPKPTPIPTPNNDDDDDKKEEDNGCGCLLLALFLGAIGAIIGACISEVKGLGIGFAIGCMIAYKITEGH